MNGVVYALISDLGDLRFRDLVGKTSGESNSGWLSNFLESLVRDTLLGFILWILYEQLINTFQHPWTSNLMVKKKKITLNWWTEAFHTQLILSCHITSHNTMSVHMFKRCKTLVCQLKIWQRKFGFQLDLWVLTGIFLVQPSTPIKTYHHLMLVHAQCIFIYYSYIQWLLMVGTMFSIYNCDYN